LYSENGSHYQRGVPPSSSIKRGQWFMFHSSTPTEHGTL